MDKQNENKEIAVTMDEEKLITLKNIPVIIFWLIVITAIVYGTIVTGTIVLGGLMGEDNDVAYTQIYFDNQYDVERMARDYNAEIQYVSEPLYEGHASVLKLVTTYTTYDWSTKICGKKWVLFTTNTDLYKSPEEYRINGF